MWIKKTLWKCLCRLDWKRNFLKTSQCRQGLSLGAQATGPHQLCSCQIHQPALTNKDHWLACWLICGLSFSNSHTQFSFLQWLTYSKNSVNKSPLSNLSINYYYYPSYSQYIFLGIQLLQKLLPQLHWMMTFLLVLFLYESLESLHISIRKNLSIKALWYKIIMIIQLVARVLISQQVNWIISTKELW